MIPMTITKEYWTLILTMLHLGFHWFPNGWKLEPIESTPTNVSFEQLLLNKVKPIQEKQKEMTYELR